MLVSSNKWSAPCGVELSDLASRKPWGQSYRLIEGTACSLPPKQAPDAAREKGCARGFSMLRLGQDWLWAQWPMFSLGKWLLILVPKFHMSFPTSC